MVKRFFVLCHVSRFSYDYDIFVGGSSNSVPEGCLKLSVSPNDLENHNLFFENWFNSFPLKIYLTKKALLPLGSVRIKRLKSVIQIKKKGWTAMVKKESIIRNVCWNDNKGVNVNICQKYSNCWSSKFFEKRKFACEGYILKIR